MTTATLTDVENRLGRPLDASEQSLATTLLSDVELLILRRVPDLASLDQATLVMVEAMAVARVIRNPEGIKSQNAETFAYTVDSAVSSGRLKLLPDEWYLLGVQRRYASIPMKFRSPDAPLPW